MHPLAPDGRKAGPLQFFAATVFVVTLGVQVRMGLANLYPAELMLLVLLGVSIFTRTLPRPPRWLTLTCVLWLLLVLSALPFSDAPEQLLRAARNVSAPLLALLVFSLVRFTEGQWVGLLKVFALAGVCLACLGIHQAVAGYDSSATVFTLGLVSQESDYLLDVIQWKLANMSAGNLALGKALSLGLHVYSNNFGEYMVYVAIAVFGLRRMREIGRPYFAAATLLVVAATLLSGSRTGLIGLLLLLAHHATVSIRSLRGRIVLWLFVAIAAATAVASGFVSTLLFGYDNLATVNGRTFLNLAALGSIGQSAQTIAFGSSLAEFHERFIQSPHNTFLFLALAFGIPAAVGAFGLLCWIMRRLWRAARLVDGRERVLLQVAFTGLVWMLLYSMTWSVLEDALSGFMLALMLAPALPLLGLRVQPFAPSVRLRPVRG